MSIVTNKKTMLSEDTHGGRSTRSNKGRVWNVPTSQARWLWLLLCILLYASMLVWYLYAIRTQAFPGPFNDPLRLFGIIAFCLVLCTVAYSLRRRFMRSLPGKVQNWLWMHIWVGITAVLIALLHENFIHILHAYCQNLSCFSEGYAGTSALFALILLVVSGIIGRLLDTWQAHSISRDASTNGVGIILAIEERILQLEYTVERLCAGKSKLFQGHCMQALEQGITTIKEDTRASIPANEQADYQRVQETLLTHTHLVQSLQRQKRAQAIIRIWRSVHMVLASIAMLIILYHGLMELFKSVLHL